MEDVKIEYKAVLAIKNKLVAETIKDYNISLSNRVSFSIEKEKEGLKISIEAKDNTAFRMALNSITKLLKLVEDADKIN